MQFVEASIFTDCKGSVFLHRYFVRKKPVYSYTSFTSRSPVSQPSTYSRTLSHRLALRYTPNAKPDALHVSATGVGGLSEFISTLPSDDAVFGFVRVNIGNDEYSQRAKFVFVRWCGPETKVMRKAKLGIHSGEVTSVIRTYAVEIQTDETRDLAEDRVMTLVRKAMGANCEFEVMLWQKNVLTMTQMTARVLHTSDVWESRQRSNSEKSGHGNLSEHRHILHNRHV